MTEELEACSSGGLKDRKNKPTYHMLPYPAWPSGTPQRILSEYFQATTSCTLNDLFGLVAALAPYQKEAAEIMFRSCSEGGGKYPSFNWCKGLRTSDVVNSVIRHSLSVEAGEEVDQESGFRHKAHILCNVSMLIFSFMEGVGEDDCPRNLFHEDR